MTFLNCLSLSDYDGLLCQTLQNGISSKLTVADMDEKDFEILLQPDESLADVYPSGPRLREGCFGYPVAPLYKNLAQVFHIWSKKSSCPVYQLPFFEAFDDKEYMTQFHAVDIEVFELLKGLESLWDLWNLEEKMFRMRSILRCLKRRGILTLLGIRKTCGSVDVWPPPLSALISSFDSPISNGSALSEGARAISKHYIRDNTAKFWGQCKGNDAQKTSDAKKRLIELADSAVWINVHELPGHLPVIEIRQENGYGARWAADGLSFRGLLEPHMVDGHAVGWKH